MAESLMLQDLAHLQKFSVLIDILILYLVVMRNWLCINTVQNGERVFRAASNMVGNAVPSPTQNSFNPSF